MRARGSLIPYAFILGGRDDHLLLALALFVEEQEKEEGAPELTATDLFFLLEDDPAPHPNIDVEFDTIRQLTLALGRLRERGFVYSRPLDPYGQRARARTLVWDLTDEGWQHLGRLCVLKPERRPKRGRAA